jgi:ATP-dependent protease ClpP protease subunit
MKTGFSEMAASFLVPRVEAKVLGEVFFRMRLDHPEIFYAVTFKYRSYQDSNNLEIIPEYLFEKSKVKDHQKAMKARVEKLVRPAAKMSEKEKDGSTRDLIKELGILTTGNNFESEIQYINIIGSIEGHTVLPADTKATKYEHLIPQLIAVEENPDLKGLMVILNTVGGDVEAGLALAEMISTLSKPTVSLVLGGGHSIGIPLAVATDYSFIAKTATMTLHPIRTTGLVITSETTFDYMRKTQNRVIDFITNHSKAERREIVRLMTSNDNMSNDVGTILIGKDAVNIGMIDSVGGVAEALAHLRKLISENN